MYRAAYHLNTLRECIKVPSLVKASEVGNVPSIGDGTAIHLGESVSSGAFDVLDDVRAFLGGIKLASVCRIGSLSGSKNLITRLQIARSNLPEILCSLVLVIGHTDYCYVTQLG